MKRFFTADLHVSHRRICEFEPTSRPFSDVSHMNEAIVERWNAVVSPEDEIYVLGDVALGPTEEWDNVLSRLTGHKHLIVGNHEKIFAANKLNYIKKHSELYNQWFETVRTHDTIWLDDGTIAEMSHFPYDGDHVAEDRYSEYRLPDAGRPLLHGHVHGQSTITRSKRNSIQIHVGMDAHNLTPVSEDAVIEMIWQAKSKQ